MPSNPSHPISVRRIVPGAFLVLVILLVALVGASNLIPQVSVHSETVSRSAHRESTDELSISLTSSGFQPQQVQHSAGTFAIAVDNTVHSGEYTIRLRASDGTLLKEVQVQKGSTAFTVELSAGAYTLTESSNSQWTCNLTIQ
jgi:hypothetical protein